MKSRTSHIWIIAAFCLSILITWIGSRPNWDDAGIVGGLLLVSTLILGFLSPKRVWLWMLVVVGGIPLVGLLVTQHSGSLATFLFGIIGASAGALGRKVVAVFWAAFT